MTIQVRILKRINYGIQCELSSDLGQAVVDYFADAKKRTLYAQSVSGHEIEAVLAEKTDRIRDALDAARGKWNRGRFSIDIGEAQATLPGMEESKPAAGASRRPVGQPARTGEMAGLEGWELFTDGGASPNPGPGACAWIIRRPDGAEEEGARYAASTTNNRMELMGVIEGLGRIPRAASVTVRCDSRYVQQGISSWIIGWKKKGWKTSTGSDVLNRDLWEQLDAASAGREIRWLWVRGHAGHAENERCDELVGLARRGRRDIGM